MEGVQQFVQARLADLTAAQGLASKAWQDRTLPVWSDIPASSLYTTLAGMVLVQVLFAMATSKGRRLVFDVVETILAIILICVLLAIVIGLPIGIVYIFLKAISFLLSLALGVPFVANLLGSISSALGQ